MVADDNEVGASERWTGIEPAQLADWTVDGSALLMVDSMILWASSGVGRSGVGRANFPH